jgi:lipoprotein-anchoring transpeptidase ErfK/SrfK
MQTRDSEIWLRVSVAAQTLEVRTGEGELLRTFPISTSRFGLGAEPGSFRTPAGRFRVGAKIGDGAELGAIFKSREPTGGNGLNSDDEDLVLTRILWLEGGEPHNANTRDRYIYIHGTNHEDAIGQPASHGCIRMKNADIVELFDLAQSGTEVRIEPD